MIGVRDNTDEVILLYNNAILTYKSQRVKFLFKRYLHLELDVFKMMGFGRLIE